jgi:hypothetical protein
MEQYETTAPPAVFIACYNYNKASYTRPEYPYPNNTNLNKIVEQEDNNNNIEEI